jgi:hypothetical protein
MASKKQKAKIATSPLGTSKFEPNTLITGPKLRRMLDVSSVTLWRWRHDDSMGFPAAKRINRRLYFTWHEIVAWIEGQSEIA